MDTQSLPYYKPIQTAFINMVSTQTKKKNYKIHQNVMAHLTICMIFKILWKQKSQLI